MLKNRTSSLEFRTLEIAFGGRSCCLGWGWHDLVRFGDGTGVCVGEEEEEEEGETRSSSVTRHCGCECTSNFQSRSRNVEAAWSFFFGSQPEACLDQSPIPTASQRCIQINARQQLGLEVGAQCEDFIFFVACALPNLSVVRFFFETAMLSRT